MCSIIGKLLYQKWVSIGPLFYKRSLCTDIGTKNGLFLTQNWVFECPGFLLDTLNDKFLCRFEKHRELSACWGNTFTKTFFAADVKRPEQIIFCNGMEENSVRAIPAFFLAERPNKSWE